MNTPRRLVTIAVSLLFLVLSPLRAQVSSGAGTAGKIPVWTGPHSQGDSIMLQKSGKIGIATTAPTSPLTVAGGTSTVATFATSNTAGTALRATSSTGVGSYTFSDSGTGLYGSSNSGYGIYGFHQGNDGTHAAVFGKDSSTSFTSAALLGIANGGSGVRGQSTDGYGVYGISTGNIGVRGSSTTGYGLYGDSTNDYGAYITSNNSDAADFHGGNWGIYVRSTGINPAVDAANTRSSPSSSSYGGKFTSSSFRGGYFTTGSVGFYSLFVDGVSNSGTYMGGNLIVSGNLVVNGSKTGYVVDQMQNVDSTALEPGDVVALADVASGTPIVGEIPVPRIHRAATAYDTAAVGVVDQITYVPADSVRQAYVAQQQEDRAEADRMANLTPEAKRELTPAAERTDRISDADGNLHADLTATRAERGRYCSVVTLGAYKAVKVDASYGAIRVGDLLTTSPHAGYAMRVSDRAAASGAIIGKALSNLPTGTGTVSVLVTLK